MESAMRNSCFAPEIAPIDSTPQPYTDYSGPQTFIDKSQKEVALGDARLEIAVESGKEAYNIGDLEHNLEREHIQLSRRAPLRSLNYWYEKFREFLKENVGWLLVALVVVVITVIVKATAGGGIGGKPRNLSNGTLIVSKYSFDATIYILNEVKPG